MGLVIATLVTANILKVLQYSSMLKRTKVIILAPLFGVIGGGSCCISIPILLAEAIPAANIVFFSPIGDTALFLAYVLLPPLTAIALKLNFDSMKPKIPKNFRISYGSLEQREKPVKKVSLKEAHRTGNAFRLKLKGIANLRGISERLFVSP